MHLLVTCSCHRGKRVHVWCRVAAETQRMEQNFCRISRELAACQRNFGDALLLRSAVGAKLAVMHRGHLLSEAVAFAGTRELKKKRRCLTDPPPEGAWLGRDVL